MNSHDLELGLDNGKLPYFCFIQHDYGHIYLTFSWRNVIFVSYSDSLSQVNCIFWTKISQQKIVFHEEVFG